LLAKGYYFSGSRNDVRSACLLRNYQGSLFGMQMRPDRLLLGKIDNPFVTAHRLLPRPVIEDWLAGLRLARPGRRNRLSDRLV
jgi:hypothetical protein